MVLGGAGTSASGLHGGKKTVHDHVLAAAQKLTSMSEEEASKFNISLLEPTILDADGAFDPGTPFLIADVPTSMELRGQCIA